MDLEIKPRFEWRVFSSAKTIVAPLTIRVVAVFRGSTRGYTAVSNETQLELK